MIWVRVVLLCLPTMVLGATCESSLLHENIAGNPVLVHKLTTGRSSKDRKHPGIPIHELFGDEPQIIIGVDRSNSSMPYLIIGDTVVKIVSHRSEYHTVMIYNASLKMSLPTQVETTIYKLGTKRVKNLRPGYFIRLTGIDPEKIREREKNLDVNRTFSLENESWEGMIWNLMKGLKKNGGTSFNCDNTSCDNLAQLLSKSAAFGFVSEGEKVGAEYYVLDENSLSWRWRLARNKEIAGKVGMGLVWSTLAATGAATAVLFYDVIANMMGWPEILRALGLF